MKRYQYSVHRINLNTTEGNDLLNKLGREGWELKAIDIERIWWVFMREFPSPTIENSAVNPKKGA